MEMVYKYNHNQEKDDQTIDLTIVDKVIDYWVRKLNPLNLLTNKRSTFD